MPKSKITKECTDIRICIGPETSEAIELHKSKLHVQKGLRLKKHEAASDLFEELVKKNK